MCRGSTWPESAACGDRGTDGSIEGARPFSLEQRNDLPGARAEVAAAGLRRGRGPGCGHPHAAERARLRARRARVSVHRPAGRRQDDHRAAARQGAGVHGARRGARACGECPLVRRLRRRRALDVLEIDGASNSGVDEIRTLRENVKYSPGARRASRCTSSTRCTCSRGRRSTRS